MTIYHILRKGLPVCLLALLSGGCKKLIDIPAPTTSITTDLQFSSNTLANAAIISLYYGAFSQTGGHNWASFITQYAGSSSDELILFQGPTDASAYQINSNTLFAGTGTSTNGDIGLLWNNPYYTVYMANAAIPSLASSTGVSDSLRTEYTGEAKFMRALAYFYLTNLFGNVPLALSIDYNITSKLPNAAQADIYKQIVQDLHDAAGSLAADFSLGGGERIRATKWAAYALLSRVYLYQGDWTNAAAMADSVINHTQSFSLVTDPAAVFNKNSSEAILQFQLNSTAYYFYNATPDGYYFLPYGASGSQPTVTDYLSPQQVAAFEPGDQRYAKWVTSFVSGGQTYFTAYKYTIGQATYASGAAVPQYYMALRLAELYLIRAEARVHNNDLAGAAADLNTIRARAALAPTTAASPDDLLNAILHERQTELFAEWGHRWLDLKRAGKALSVLSAIPLHAAINQTQLLYPIPTTELTLDPNLRQNSGY